MKLPFSVKKKEVSNYYLALLLRDEKARAVVFEELGGKIHVIGEHEEQFDGALETLALEALLETLDKTISTAEGSLPPNIETQKTVFGLKPSWIQDNKIKKEYLGKLKKICEALGLTPIGFLVITEAIVHLLERDEGAPLTAILVEIQKKSTTVSLVKAGKILETKTTHVEDSLPETVDRMLHHFTGYEILPARMIIFDGKEDDDINQEFIAHTWSKSLPFLHVPQIQTLTGTFDAKAVLFGAATQMGFEVVSHSMPKTVKPSEPISQFDEPENEKEEESKKSDAKDNKDEANNEFGFKEDEDIAYKKEEEKEKQEEEVSEINDIGEKDTKEEETAIDETPREEFHEELPTHAVPQTHHTRQKNRVPQFLSSVIPLFTKMKEEATDFIKHSPLKSISLPQGIPGGPKKGGKFIFIIPVVILLLIALFATYIFTSKATITLTASAKKINESPTLTISTSSPTDASQNILGADAVSVDETGSVSTNATGTKDVGEKAKGSVTIYNSSLSEGKNVAKGSVITSSNGIDFILDNDVKVSSASGDASAITPSTGKVSVTAKEIGKEGNLPSGTKFTVSGQPSSAVIAKNDSAFGGGSKQQITVVAKKDVDQLLAELPKKLESKAQEDFMKQISSDKEVLPVTTSVAVTKTTFDKKVGEEAKTVTLNGTVTLKNIAYKKSDLKTIAENNLKKNQSNFSDFEAEIVSKLENIKDNGKQIQATLNVSAQLFPKINKTSITTDIAGKSVDQANDILKKIPQVSSVDIVLQPSIGFLPQMLPRRAGNITIDIIKE